MSHSSLETGASTLDCRTRLGFAFGHIFNDLCASIWFSYGLLFYKLTFDELGYIFVVFGQVIDAFATIVLGFLLDAKCLSHKNFFNRFYGRYTSYYIIGTILSFLSFPYEISELKLILQDQKTLYVVTLLSIFVSQIGWTMVQLSHLSLINEISLNSSDRIWLTSLRQAASIYSSIVVYFLFWFTLAQTDPLHLSYNDIYVFANNSFLITIYGLVHCMAFILIFKERSLVLKKQRNYYGDGISSNKLNIKQKFHQKDRPMDNYQYLDWFKDVIYFKIAFIYMCSRLYMNLSMAYTPLYLQQTLLLEKTSIAFIPLLIYLSGMLMSFFSNYIEKTLGNKFHMSIGICLGMFACIWILFGSCNDPTFKQWQIYLIAIQIGLSMTIIKISSISLVAEMIGHNLKNISFVYGSVSCLEKIAGSIVISIIEQFDQFGEKTIKRMAEMNDYNKNHSILCEITQQENKMINSFYQYILSYGNMIVLSSLLIALLTLIRVDLKQ